MAPPVALAAHESRTRHYAHGDDDADVFDGEPATFTDWEPRKSDTDLLFCEGLHSGVVDDTHDLAQPVDLLIGVVPISKLEWFQKIHRDRAVRGYGAETAMQMILRRMPDYQHYICPQFSRTDINFQRTPTIDTSNPFKTHEIPTNDEIMVVINIANRRKIMPDFGGPLEMLSASFMSRPDTPVPPAGKHVLATELNLAPVINRWLDRRNQARATR